MSSQEEPTSKQQTEQRGERAASEKDWSPVDADRAQQHTCPRFTVDIEAERVPVRINCQRNLGIGVVKCSERGLHMAFANVPVGSLADPVGQKRLSCVSIKTASTTLPIYYVKLTYR